jgi:small neutral amino acid transporter SnatA (MarC family)
MITGQKYLRAAALASLIVGALLASEDFPLPVPRPEALAAAFFGAAVVVAFIENILPLNLIFPDWAGERAELSAGMAERLWGMILLSIGFIMIFAGLVEWFFPGWLGRYLLDSPAGQGLAIFVAGMLIFLRGAIYFLASEHSGGPITRTLTSLSARAFGVLLIFLGVGLVGLGWLRIAMPGLISAFVRGLIPPLPTPPVP